MANYTDEQLAQMQAASIENLERGGLPVQAINRLREQAARQNSPQHFWTSDLSVNELSLVHNAGYQPLGQVMGSTIYHVGWQIQPYNWSNTGQVMGYSTELGVMTQAYYHARHLALGRLQQEAQLLGASGVVGVRLDAKPVQMGETMLEFKAVGTAIREEGRPAPVGNAPLPFLSNLSGSEFWQLRVAGFEPAGIAVGNCTYYCIPGFTTQWATGGGWLGGGWSNQELTDYTQALYQARELAMSRMEAEGRMTGAAGIVGVTMEAEAEPHEVDTGNHTTRMDMLYHFTVIGTAIRPGGTPPPKLNIMPVLSMKPPRE